MKRLSYLFNALMVLIIVSCSSNAPKEINPTSTEFISGELAKLIEVVEEPCQLSYAENEGSIATQYIKLKVKLRLTKESPSLQKVDARDIDFTGLLSVAMINLVDENGTNVQDLSVKSEELLKLKRLLQGKVGDEDVITFEGEFHNSKEAPKWFDKTTAFTPYMTGDTEVEGDEAEVNNDNCFSLNLRGVLGGSDDAELTYNDKIDEGEVVFTVNGVRNVRKIKMGSYDKITNKLILKEFFTNGNYVGDFDGVWKAGIYEGVFTNTKGGRVNFKLQGTANVGESIGNNDDSFEDSDFTTGKGDSSIDEFLDEYEEFWNRYVKFLEKVDRDDPTAMIEYAKLLKQNNDFIKKYEKIKGKMSMDQINRINKLNAELANKMKKMQ